MGIDRADDGDAPDRGPARRADPGPDATPLLDPARRAAEHTRYRGTIEETYVARDAWAEAFPSLRSAWKEHVEKYPERSRLAPSTQPDGSWVADGGRKLNPEQNAEVDRGVAHIREVGKNVIIPGMRAVEAEDTARCLAGFEHRFKGEDRLKEKVADQVRSTPELMPTDALATIPDVVRFTFQYSESVYTAGVLHDIERLEAHGFTQVERRNTWTDDQYKGINSRWREPESGALFEVQFHTQASLEAKELTHKAYERIRSTAQDPELAELKEFQRRVNSIIPIPPGVTEIEDYPPGET